MRLGVVRGSVVLSLGVPELRGIRLAIVEPITRERLAAGGRMGGGKPIMRAGRMGLGNGHVVGVVEGRTAASPFWPAKVPGGRVLRADRGEHRVSSAGREDRRRKQDRRQKTIVCPTGG